MFAVHNLLAHTIQFSATTTHQLILFENERNKYSHFYRATSQRRTGDKKNGGADAPK